MSARTIARHPAFSARKRALTPPRILKAGPLSAEFEAGNLRYIRYAGIEIMRAVSFIVRDKDWGTYNPDLSNLARSRRRLAAFASPMTRLTSDAAQSFPLPGRHRRIS